jgi:hypothetical protein
MMGWNRNWSEGRIGDRSKRKAFFCSMVPDTSYSRREVWEQCNSNKNLNLSLKADFFVLQFSS